MEFSGLNRKSRTNPVRLFIGLLRALPGYCENAEPEKIPDSLLKIFQGRPYWLGSTPVLGNPGTTTGAGAAGRISVAGTTTVARAKSLTVIPLAVPYATTVFKVVSVRFV
jgi:hypothetical protein